MIENRRSIFFHEGLKLELDMTNFGEGHTDYEIEAEYNIEDEVRSKLTTLLGTLKIVYRVQDKTKFQRFLESKKIKMP